MNKQVKQPILGLLIISALAILPACSDDKSAPASNQTEAKSANTAKSHHIDHVKPGEATDSVKNKFISQFSKSCIDRELKNSTDLDNDTKRVKPTCECIANKIAEDLSDLDAEKYLQMHEDTQTIEIKFDHAAYFCLQAKPLPKGPHLFGKQ